MAEENYLSEPARSSGFLNPIATADSREHHVDAHQKISRTSGFERLIPPNQSMKIPLNISEDDAAEIGQDTIMMQMTREIAGASPLYRPSNFWNDLNKKNFEMLAELGVENFKRTVAQNYFNWLVVGIRDVQFRNALRSWMRRPSILPLLNRLEFPDALRTTTGLEGRVGRWGFFLYKMFVGMLWEHAARLDRSGLSLTLEEPPLGRPIVILRKGRRISQDLANSFREYNSITADDIGLPANDRRVAELGAGYGRLAYVFLSDGASRYFIFDIPPALYVSQWYLTRLLPTKRIFRFRPIRDFSDVQRDVESSEIGFFTPNQMELFPDRFFDAMVSISTLPEMTKNQIDNYLKQMNRLSSRYIYLKQWLNWRNPLDGHEVKPSTFFLGSDWRLILDRQDEIQSLFFERLWRRTSS
jgi:putative sugar O-methyltransferase